MLEENYMILFKTNDIFYYFIQTYIIIQSLRLEKGGELVIGARSTKRSLSRLIYIRYLDI